MAATEVGVVTTLMFQAPGMPTAASWGEIQAGRTDTVWSPGRDTDQVK